MKLQEYKNIQYTFNIVFTNLVRIQRCFNI